MRRQDFQYPLPPELIAQYPLKERGMSRLLSLDAGTGEYRDGQFQDLTKLLNKGDLLVFNDTRVIPARLLGQKHTGGKVEVLVERILDTKTVLAHVRASKSPGPGTILELEQDIQAEVSGREDDLFLLKFSGEKTALEILEQYGHMPLPPYIQRPDTKADQERYQTVYASKPGAVAAPTAGLHFDQDMLDRLKQKGINFSYVTLHVGAGTFQPVRVDDITEHKMHSEYLEVSQQVCEQVEATRAVGGRVIAVGTTSVRCLESASWNGTLKPYCGETDIFIYPGYEFKCINGLITNFHLPESTLLMLVCAFGGYENVMRAYGHAIEQEYRFFSYGDAMFLNK